MVWSDHVYDVSTSR